MKKIYLILLIAFIPYIIIAELFSIYIPIEFSSVFILFSFYYFIKLFREDNIGIVSLLYFIVFTVPFLHLIPYIWIDVQSQGEIVWGLASNSFQFNEEIIDLVGVMACCGIAGMILPTFFAGKKNIDISKNTKLKIFKKSMPIVVWFFWLFIGLYLSIISAPSDNLLDAAYTTVGSVSRDLNVSSAWLLSYIILLFTLYDSLIEQNKYLRKVKKLSVFTVIIYIILVLQFFRGDRESIPWILACILMLYYWFPYLNKSKIKVPKIKLLIFFISIFAISYVVGFLRSRVSGSADLSDVISVVSTILIENPELLKGTWTAVLLTPLSVAGEHVLYNKPYLFGLDYINLFLSSPPGFITDIFGYERPWSLGKGPANEMIYGLGGTHSSVLPFRNFGLIGITIITYIIFYFLIKVDNLAFRKPSISTIVLLATLVTVIPHWAWYGEKNLLNGLIMYFILLWFYRISVAFKDLGKQPEIC